MDAEVSELLVSLHGADSVEAQWDTIDEWAAEDAVERLREAALALGEPASALAPRWAVESVRERIVRVLALTPRLEFARAAGDVARGSAAPAVASLAASRQPLDVCAQLVEEADEGDEEFLACLIQELVVRVEHLERDPFGAYWERIRSRAHPLGWLGLRLEPIEASIALPEFSLEGSAVSLPVLSDEGSNEPRAMVAPLAREVADAGIGRRLTAAVDSWLEHSNGRAESRIFALAPGDEPQALADALAGAGLDCVGDGGPTRVAAVDVDQVFAVLFSAASMGGAYDSGYGGAYGRLRAWRTLGALSGAREGDTVDVVGALASQCRWFGFDSPWFEDVAWDIGLAVVDRDGTRLTVFGATDTD